MNRTIAIGAAALAIGFTAGRFLSPQVNNEDVLIRVIATQQVELDAAHELIEAMQDEREDVKAMREDRFL